ncbi:flagellar biosynthetic protein FliO [Paenibacillus filicis]|uniref:Flagellar biosynthetic protein FliO n=1 Tax=Paenibacillus gyeongsangnamensis TaxID=3388067 RepID=A0ABT4Q655_9BACL|nr:flagellar biosynthetic protein FliO [Paenibacillus filicis]MCZ8512359.1 flagellar biosynthetic protein FliO [Paenibacillus filicis]
MIRRAVRVATGVVIGWLQTAVFAAVCFGETGAEPFGSKLVDPQTSPYPGVSPADTGWMIVKVIVFLILIIGIFLLVMKLISKKTGFLSGRAIRSLGGVPLGQNKSIQIVEIGKSLYIVGVGQEVQLLEKIDNEDEVAYLIEALTAGSSSSAVNFETFGGFLRKLRRKEEAEEEEMDVSASFQQVFHHKMQHMTDRKKMLEDLLMDENKKDRLNDK